MQRDVVDEGGHVSSYSREKNNVFFKNKKEEASCSSSPPLFQDGVPALLRRDDVDDLAATLRTKLHCTSSECEQGVVASTTDVDAGVEVSATLTNEDFARENFLAAEALYAETLCVGVTTVSGRTRSLFMCHFVVLL
jgi:hypothetical protein